MTRSRASVHCPHRCNTDRGSISIVSLGVVAVLAALLLSMARIGRNAHDAARARTAADAAALAGAQGGRVPAGDLARANGAALVSFVSEGDTVTVQVVVGDAQATARASARP